MNLDLQSLLDAIKNAKPRTKLVAVLALVAVVAVASIGGMVASRPSFVLLYSGLDDTARAGVEKSLATGAIRYRVSQPPGPYVVYVDEGQYYEAQNLVALSGSLKEMPRGVDPISDGASSLFLSTAERAQSMQKRDWQEMERQLEALDFVAHATVTTSAPDTSPLRERKPPTVSVLLRLENLTDLAREQTDNVAKLVRFRFGVPAENVVISDQSGRTLFDPSSARDGKDHAMQLAHSRAYDRELELKVNQQLALVYGDRKALVTVTSEWDHDQTTTVAETLSPKGTLVSEKKMKTETPQDAQPSLGGSIGGSVGGPAGTASNLPGDPSMASAEGAPEDEPAGPVATTSEETKSYETARSKTQTVHSTPMLDRLSVSLVLDESLATKKDEIRALVQAAVGFSTERNDVIEVGTTTFAPPPEVEPSTAPAEDGRMSPLVEMLIKRAIEVAAALAFLVVLFKTIKGSRRAAATATGAGSNVSGGNRAHDDAAAHGDVEPDPELLARARIEELVRTDPRRVGEILSRWAGEGRQAARSGK